MKHSEWKKAFHDSLPVLAGYVVLGAGFGLIMHANGFTLWHAVAMSLFIYAGSMQYTAVPMLVAGTPLLTLALTTLAVNARHLFYGISMIEKYQHTGSKKPYLIFALTDETYSLVCTGEKSEAYCFHLSWINQSYWVAGTALGALAGQSIAFNTTGIDFALTALFITVFIEQWLTNQDHFPALVGLLCSILCLVLLGAEQFLIPAMVAITVILLIKYQKEEQHE